MEAFLFLGVLLASSVESSHGGCSLEKVVEDVAVTVVSEAATLLHGNGFDVSNLQRCPPRDCAAIQRQGKTQNGVYKVWPDGNKCGVDVYCDLEEDGGGWTVIQRRGSFGNPPDYFYKRWRDYKFGFGNISEDFWLGNDKISELTRGDNYVLRVVLQTKTGETRHAQYDEFILEPEITNYTLQVFGYSGDAGDSLADYHGGQMFSTWDRDNEKDPRNCARQYTGAWWFKGCFQSNLNGRYLDGQAVTSDGVSWRAWKGERFSYHRTLMKVRPKWFL